jgi:glucosamine-6-phosphate deaminase
VEIKIFDTKAEMGKEAANLGALKIKEALEKNDLANIILATGASQFEMLHFLVRENVEWKRINCFHLDEYIGLPDSHPASFRKYLKERFYNLVDVNEFHFINADKNEISECNRLNTLIKDYEINVAFIGIGENGHLAFNDPPADFETEDSYIIVDLDENCRLQQLGEGWFPDFESVPKRAVSMSIKQILKSKSIICTVPDIRKSEAVYKAINEPVSPEHPATILRTHGDTTLFLDKNSASLMDPGNYDS